MFISVSLPSDPKGWSREDVAVFLAYCEKEFDLEKIDMDKFQMNGKSQDVYFRLLTQKKKLYLFSFHLNCCLCIFANLLNRELDSCEYCVVCTY